MLCKVENFEFDLETDIVVVGYGGAGAAAAIAAHDCKADVLILEKMAVGGGSTRASGGVIAVPLQKEYLQYIEKLCLSTVSREVLERFVNESMKTELWIKELGAELVTAVYLRVTVPPLAGMSWAHIPGAEFGMKKHVKPKSVVAAPDNPPGKRLWDLLASNIESRRIKIMTNTPVKELITNLNGEIIGVIAETNGKECSIMARRAVILTCGGYEYNDALKEDTLPAKPTVASGNPGNTGDGIRMAQKVGADLWHMANLACCAGFKTQEYEAAFPVKFYSENFILVDKYGKRFADEASIEVHEFGRVMGYFDYKKIEYPRIPMYCIFDEILRRKAPLFDGVSGYNRDKYKWSLDNSEELRKGWIIQGKAVGELANKLGMDKTNLENTVKRYNENCKAGVDPDYGRAKEYLGLLEKPPYYAIKLWPALYNTQGGPRRDKEARVLNVEERPIPRLYSAGELGSIWGLLNQGGSNNAESLAFGRIAGRNAAAEKPWR